MSVLISWFDFGKYSLYIWPAYGLVVCVLLMGIARIKLQKKKIMAQLNQWMSGYGHE